MDESLTEATKEVTAEQLEEAGNGEQRVGRDMQRKGELVTAKKQCEKLRVDASPKVSAAMEKARSCPHLLMRRSRIVSCRVLAHGGGS